MLLEPSVVVLYVDNVAKASQFYQDLLGLSPIEASPTFHSFKMSGMHLALKATHSVIPPVEKQNAQGELAFVLECNQKVDELFAAWQAKEITMILAPTQLPFGYSFVALDPDGNRLRAVALGGR